jgi:histidinol-phosphate aminotransferase
VRQLKLDNLLATELRDIVPYTLTDLMQQIDTNEITKLDLNENMCVDNQLLTSIVRIACSEVDPKQYPEPQAALAVRALSKHLGLDQSRVYVGNGSDDVLERLARCFAKRDSSVLIVEPSFFMYRYFVGLGGARWRPVRLKPSFELDVDAILNANEASTSMLIVCSPNNPTGNQFRQEDVKTILEQFHGLVAIDEAYADFGRYSTVKWIDDFENLVVLRSFSKAYGLAALRAGYAVSNRSVIEWLKKATPPFNVNAFTQKLVEISLNKSARFETEIQRVVKERAWLIKQLEMLDGVKPYLSDTNFVLFRIMREDLISSEVWMRLGERGILVRDKGSDPLLQNCIRVTVGTRRMNLEFLRALKQILNQ